MCVCMLSCVGFVVYRSRDEYSIDDDDGERE